jgi:DNA replication licensing factor MCM4
VRVVGEAPSISRRAWSQVKPFNLRETKVVRDLNPGDVGNLISVGGMVTRTSNIIPDIW